MGKNTQFKLATCLLYFISAFAMGSTLSIKLVTGEVLKKCLLHEQTANYFCEEKGKTIVIGGPPFAPRAFVYDKNDFSDIQVSSIKDGDVEIFKAFQNTQGFPGMEGMYAPNQNIPKFPSERLENSISYKVGNLEKIKFMIDNPMFQGIEYPNNIAAIKGKLLKNLNQKINDYQKDLKAKNIIVHTQNGATLKCERQKTDLSNYDADTIQMMEDNGKEFQCLLFSCNSPEKDYFVIMDNVGNSFVDLISLKSGEYENSDKISYVENSKKDAIIHDYRDQIEGISPYQNPMGIEFELKDESFIPKELQKYKDHMSKVGMPNYEMVLQYSIASCEKKSYDKLKQAHKNFQKKLSEAELIHYITMMYNNEIGFLISPDAIPEIACHHNGTYYKPEAYQKLKEKGEIPSYVKKSITLEKANELFNKAKNMNNIAWNYKTDGCYARAHLMAREFEKEGIDVQKAWIKGDLKVETPERTTSWNFHVAPVLEVEQGDGSAIKYVIDPSIADKPVTVDDWTAIMTKGRVDKTGFPYPLNVTNFNRATLSFTDTNTYMPSEFKTTPNQYGTEEERMSAANQTMLEYKERKDEMFMSIPNYFQQ